MSCDLTEAHETPKWLHRINDVRMCLLVDKSGGRTHLLILDENEETFLLFKDCESLEISILKSNEYYVIQYIDR